MQQTTAPWHRAVTGMCADGTEVPGDCAVHEGLTANFGASLHNEPSPTAKKPKRAKPECEFMGTPCF